MKIVMTIASLFLLSMSFVYAESLEVKKETRNFDMGANFSFETKELHIPTVVVDGKTLYDVTMRLTSNDDKGMVFSLVNAFEQAPFDMVFEAIENNMSKEEVQDLLGTPQKIRFNLEKRSLAFCSEPQLISGSIYDQWDYFVDNREDAPSGFVVWFAKVEGVSEEPLVVGKSNGFSCM